MKQKQMYTHKEDLKKLLMQRRNVGLHKEIEQYWESQGNPLPPIVTSQNGELAILARHVAAARNEDFAFNNECIELGLIPAWLEFHNDMFVSVSAPKLSLIYPETPTGRKKLTNPSIWEKKKLNEISCYEGRSIVGIHNTQWEQHFSTTGIRGDVSSWLQSFGNARDYYFADLSLSLAHGVLFKDFHGKGKLSSKKSLEFTNSVVVPAFDEVLKTFGMKPIIHRFEYQDGFEIFPHM